MYSKQGWVQLHSITVQLHSYYIPLTRGLIIMAMTCLGLFRLGYCYDDFSCIGPVHKGTNHVPKAVSERDSDPFLI